MCYSSHYLSVKMASIFHTHILWTSYLKHYGNRHWKEHTYVILCTFFYYLICREKLGATRFLVGQNKCFLSLWLSTYANIKKFSTIRKISLSLHAAYLQKNYLSENTLSFYYMYDNIKELLLIFRCNDSVFKSSDWSHAETKLPTYRSM